MSYCPDGDLIINGLVNITFFKGRGFGLCSRDDQWIVEGQTCGPPRKTRPTLDQ